MDSVNPRLHSYWSISKVLAAISDDQLVRLIADSLEMHSGIGGRSQSLVVDGLPVFVKRVPLTDLELKTEHYGSTRNIFDLPLCFHYGIGSPGVGAWRELAAHILSTEWVVAELCDCFPLLYHHRVLASADSLPVMNLEEWGGIENYLKFWGQPQALAHRVESLNSARSEVLLFLEYVPETLFSWLHGQFSIGEVAAARALEFVVRHMSAATDFMSRHGFIHFDAHFNNILTDGCRLYFGDLGLALSSEFDLSAAELEFLNAHLNTYDQCAGVLNTLHAVFCHLYGSARWREMFYGYIATSHSRSLHNNLIRTPGGDDCVLTEEIVRRPLAMAPVFSTFIEQHLSLGVAMDFFLQKLKNAPTCTPYPGEKFERLLSQADDLH